MNETTSSPSPAELVLLRVEAARYALLRRLASAMRHQLVMHLQPIGMVTEVMGRRLKAPQPDLAQLQDGVSKLNGLSKVAVQECLDVITWLAPEAGASVPLRDGVAECIDLLRGNFGFRGFALQGDAGELAQPVGRAALRMLLPGALLALADATEAPADLAVTAAAEDADNVRLDIRVTRTEGSTEFAAQLPYRELRWQDVEALARAEDVQVRRTDSGAQLVFPMLE